MVIKLSNHLCNAWKLGIYDNKYPNGTDQENIFSWNLRKGMKCDLTATKMNTCIEIPGEHKPIQLLCITSKSKEAEEMGQS